MKLSVLFKRIQHAVIQMPELEEEMEIRGITCNSQKAEEDSLFVCIQGSRADGHDYIEEACNLGASCILNPFKQNRKLHKAPLFGLFVFRICCFPSNVTPDMKIYKMGGFPAFGSV